MISVKFLWGNVVFGGKLQMQKNSNFEIFESALFIKSVSMPLIESITKLILLLGVYWLPSSMVIYTLIPYFSFFCQRMFSVSLIIRENNTLSQIILSNITLAKIYIFRPNLYFLCKTFRSINVRKMMLVK